jgi:hypothetical protein
VASHPGPSTGRLVGVRAVKVVHRKCRSLMAAQLLQQTLIQRLWEQACGFRSMPLPSALVRTPKIKSVQSTLCPLLPTTPDICICICICIVYYNKCNYNYLKFQITSVVVKTSYQLLRLCSIYWSAAANCTFLFVLYLFKDALSLTEII